jgi:hypothetical protein
MPYTQRGVPYALGSATSEASAEKLGLKVATLTRVVYVIIADHSMGFWPPGITCDEIELKYGIIHQTASSRVRALVLKGLVYATNRTRITQHDCAATVWMARRFLYAPQSTLFDVPLWLRPTKLVGRRRKSNPAVPGVRPVPEGKDGPLPPGGPDGPELPLRRNGGS